LSSSDDGSIILWGFSERKEEMFGMVTGEESKCNWLFSSKPPVKVKGIEENWQRAKKWEAYGNHSK